MVEVLRGLPWCAADSYASLTFSAHGPFGPWPWVKETFWPSCSSSKLTPCRLLEWKNRSFAPPVLMNPKPLSVNFLIVPSAILLFPRILLKCFDHLKDANWQFVGQMGRWSLAHRHAAGQGCNAAV